MGTIGTAALIASLVFSVLYLVLILFVKKREWRLAAGTMASAAIIISSSILLYLLISGDFSIEYVFRNTDLSLPLIYKISAFWSGSAGSLLFWALCNSLVCLLIGFLFRKRNLRYVEFLTSVTTVLNLGFSIFLIFINNPFKPVGFSSDGFGLNPSLQSIGMVFHPPLVIISYSCIFAAFASYLYEISTHGSSEIKTAGDLSLISWLILTAGIVSGGIWAYRELGWGGYWSWDPIENSALISWLLLTALLHTQGLKKNNTISIRPIFTLISLTAFSVIFGTFLARSGIIDSVHVYSNQAAKTIFLLIIIILASVSLAVLFRTFKKRRASKASKSGVKNLVPFLPSLLMILCAAMIAFMTLSPLFFAGGLGITEKTYDFVFSLIGLPIVLFSSVYYSLQQKPPKLKAFIVSISLAAGLISFLLPSFAQYPFFTKLSLAVCVFCLTSVIAGFISGSGRLLNSTRFFVMFLIHVSIIIIAFGFVGTRSMKSETSSVIHINETVSLGNHRLEMLSVSISEDAQIKTWHTLLSYSDGKLERELEVPFKYYKKKDIYHSKARILSSFKEDTYIIVENASDDGAVLLKVSVYKWMSLLWIGIVLMAASAMFLCLKRIAGNTDYF